MFTGKPSPAGNQGSTVTMTNHRSYSWSSNICGIKKWTLFPPGQEDLLKDRLNNFAYDIRSIDESQFPNFEKARRIVLYQRDGETLFVPSGWFHQVLYAHTLAHQGMLMDHHGILG